MRRTAHIALGHQQHLAGRALQTCGGNLRSLYPLIALRAVETELEAAAAVFVDDVARVRSFGKTFAPGAQRQHDRRERVALFGKQVLVAIWVRLIAPPPEDAGFGEFLQTGG